jgi:hypothetical protein
MRLVAMKELANSLSTDFEPDWSRHSTLFEAVTRSKASTLTQYDLRDLLREARADAVRFVQDVKEDELKAAYERGLLEAHSRKATEAQ